MNSPPTPAYPAATFFDEYRITPGSIESFLPGFNSARRFLFKRTNYDIGHVAGFAVLLFTFSNSIRYFWNTSIKLLWTFSSRFTTNVRVSERDPLYRELNIWLSENVTKEKTRTLDAITAGSSQSKTTPRKASSLKDFDDTKSPIQFIPGSDSRSWFWHNGNWFYLYTPQDHPQDPKLAERTGSLTVVCLGWSCKPIERLLEEAKSYSKEEEDSSTTIHTRTGSYLFWDGRVIRPARPLETVDLEAKDKQDIVDDITRYLASRTYYSNRGIPYRKGFLLYGPPGTGKTSLSSAIAGTFNLDMYNVSLNGEFLNDTVLEKLFLALPERCVVLLEDVDAASVTKQRGREGKKRGKADNSDGSEDENPIPTKRSQVTLSGLLNVIDGVASAEGRILIMTTNHREHLDEALIRPGRIDKEIYMGYVTQEVAASIFLRMYTQSPEEAQASAAKINKVEEKSRARGRSGFIELLDNTRLSTFPTLSQSSTIRSLASPASPISPFVLGSRRGTVLEKDSDSAINDLERMAITFSKKIPNKALTPAEVQGFLLQHREDPMQALTKCDGWVIERLKERGERGIHVQLHEAPRNRDESESRKHRPRPIARAMKQRLAPFEESQKAEKTHGVHLARTGSLEQGATMYEEPRAEEEDNDGDAESSE